MLAGNKLKYFATSGVLFFKGSAEWTMQQERDVLDGPSHVAL